MGIALTALEYLARPGQLGDKGLLSWDVERTRMKAASRRRADALNVLAKPPGIHVIFALRLLAALVLLNPASPARARTIAVGYLSATTYALHYRIRYGTDGTDHMTLLTYASLFVARVLPADERVRQAVAWFLAGQTTLSYLAAGLAKAAGPSWRTGLAMPGIFRTKVYGDRRVYELLKDRRALSTVAGWAVIAGEVVLPLVLVAPKASGWGLLGLGASFHLGNAAFMGLNRFVWAFVGTYPAVVACARHLSPDDPRDLALRVGGALRRLRER
ncbi:hypothetical protein [Cellulomonas shaoxiangyii]|uniref:hypothetical protein n=1 Tax=Cellulomonas shaoxiangyii TaxID=2566013 RepID=UPI001094AE22|nr:hypothetical protein [Cellulomonas shaoxiangyii]TGY77170.1 hypothetical protein E5226_17290 [Cellulomonas shaoxiangyii]